MEQKKKIIIIEDLPLFNSMLQKTLENSYDVVAVSTSAKDIMGLYDKYTPDLILTDVVTKNGANGIKYGAELKNRYGNKVKVLAITGIPEISFLDKAKEANLDGLVYKDSNYDSLVSSIEQVLSGYRLFPDNYIYNDDSEKLRSLNDKEMKILKLLCEGVSRECIADDLNLASGTLKNYISNILNKMGFDSVSKLTVFCVGKGYIVPELEK